MSTGSGAPAIGKALIPGVLRDVTSASSSSSSAAMCVGDVVKEAEVGGASAGKKQVQIAAHCFGGRGSALIIVL